MHVPVHRRLRPALLALAALPCAALPAIAGDDPRVQRTQSPGYPRSSDVAPAQGLGHAPDDYGAAQDAEGTTYDTNWFVDADGGDTDVVWLRAAGACIQGWGNATDSDDASASVHSKSVWAEAREAISVARRPGEIARIVLTNTVAIRGRWLIDGCGTNSATLDATALMIDGSQVAASAAPAVAAEIRAESSEASEASAGSEGGGSAEGSAGTSGATAGAKVSRTMTIRFEKKGERKIAVVCTDPAQDELVRDAVVRMEVDGDACAAKYASSEFLEVRAHAAIDGRETFSTVSRLDTINVVDAAYVIVTPQGPGTPGGEDPPAPPTPGGGNGGAGPTTPGSGGTAPGSGGSAPGAGSATPGSGGTTVPSPGGAPRPADEPQRPQEPQQPSQPASEPPSQPLSGGTDLPGSGGTSAPSSGGTSAPSSGGTAPSTGGGSDLGGTPAPSSGGGETPRSGGTAPAPSGGSAAPTETPRGAGGDGNGGTLADGAGAGSTGGATGGSIVP